MLKILQTWAFQIQEAGDKFYFVKRARFNEDHVASRPRSLFEGFGNTKDGIKNRINPELVIPSEHGNPFINNIVAHCVGCVFLKHVSRGA
ncbi:MAG: hypothetical protein JW883_12930 [Deltaproteobacteria bacterium]|nr:hypothetical protein [Deltaproteobacteria bacterium]